MNGVLGRHGQGCTCPATRLHLKGQGQGCPVHRPIDRWWTEPEGRGGPGQGQRSLEGGLLGWNVESISPSLEWACRERLQKPSVNLPCTGSKQHR